jgi:hypothetical protein
VRAQVDRGLTTVSRVDRLLWLNKNMGRHKSAHIYVGADWMVGHSIRGKKTASDSEETHPSTRYTVWCSDSQKTHPMCSIFGAVH